MTIKQKINKAVEMVEAENDGSTYLQSVCGIKELTQALESVSDNISADVIRDAITIKRYKNSIKV